MDLARLTVAARPRNPWEGIDLGFAMARQWFLPLWKLWWMTALPLNLLLMLFCSERFWLLMLLSWWLKPLYEPPLLYWLSRALFGERLLLWSLAWQWLHIVRPRLLANLTWRRLNPNRSFHMPVVLLEQLRGKAREERLRVLGRRQQAGVWLTVMGIHFEVTLEISFTVLLILLLPEELQWLDWENLFLKSGSLEHWLEYAGALLAMSLIAPFYVAGGFALYLTRRIDLEAWDLEIAFRHMQERRRSELGAMRKGAAALLLALGLALPVTWQAAEAVQISAEEAKQVIQEVLAEDDFGKWETLTYWEYVDKGVGKGAPDDPLLETLMALIRGFFKGLAAIGEFLLWGVGAVLLIFIAYRVAENQQWFQRLFSPQRKKASTPLAELFGLDVRLESLPTDLVAEVLAKLKQGRHREALSLLYRGTLAKLIHEFHLEIPASATEGECLQRVSFLRPERETDFFGRLTRLWIRTAYGHLSPAADQLEALCRDWHAIYSRRHEK